MAPRRLASFSVQSDFHTRVEGMRIKHSLNRQAIKNVDKQKRVLRIECTTNDVTFYRHHRKVAQRAGGYRLPTGRIEAIYLQSGRSARAAGSGH